MNQCLLSDVTITIDPRADLAMAGHRTTGSERFAEAFRRAAEMLCDGHASVTVEQVTCAYGASTGCNREWAEEFGLWQAVHDCVERVDSTGDWIVNMHAVAMRRKQLAVRRSRNDPSFAAACGID